jgi:hypothetical protein
MGKRSTVVPFVNNAGGINELSPFQMQPDECQGALNVMFTKYNKFGIISKRRGYDKVNAVAMDGKVQALNQFFISGVSYLHAFTDAGKCYSIDVAAGTCTLLQSGLSTTKRFRFAILNNVAFACNYDDGLMQSTGGVWTAVADVNKPSNPVDIIQFDGHIFAITAAGIEYSGTGDGTDWTSATSSTFDIDKNDGDSCIALAKLGETLVAFKSYSIHRINITGNTTVPYRRTPVYSGKTGTGIGCASRESIRNVTLENLYSDVWGKAEYLLFISAEGLHALGSQGNPIDIDQRVRNTFTSIRKDRLSSSFAVYHSNRDQYMLYYPQGSKFTSTDQLIFNNKAKAWSKYDFANMTSATEYIDTKTVYIIMGSKDGYVYKHDWQESVSLTDYSDNGTAITAYWQSQFFDFGVPDRYKQIFETTVRVRETDTNCPVTVGVYGEDGNNVIDTINTTGSLTGGRYDSAVIGTDIFASDLGYADKTVITPLYCYNASYRFGNAGNNQSMDIYAWFTELMATKNKGVRQ